MLSLDRERLKRLRIGTWVITGIPVPALLVALTKGWPEVTVALIPLVIGLSFAAYFHRCINRLLK